jgi:hypothetical protein
MSYQTSGAVAERPTEEQAVSHIRDPEELITTVVELLGFRPVDSIVIVVLEDARMTLVARFDVELALDRDHLAERLVALQQPENTFLLIGFCDDAERVVAALRAVGTRLDGVLGCFVAEFCGPEIPGTADALRREDIAARVAGSGSDEPAALLPELTLKERRTRCAELLDAATSGRDLDSEELIQLANLVQDGQVRDAVWLRLNIDNADDQLALWLAVLDHTPDVQAPAVLCLVGFAAWLTGDGTLLSCCLERGLGLAPDFPMLRSLEYVNLKMLSPHTWSRAMSQYKNTGGGNLG